MNREKISGFLFFSIQCINLFYVNWWRIRTSAWVNMYIVWKLTVILVCSSLLIVTEEPMTPSWQAPAREPDQHRGVHCTAWARRWVFESWASLVPHNILHLLMLDFKTGSEGINISTLENNWNFTVLDICSVLTNGSLKHLRNK